jgi:hypothetical protein
VEKKNGDLMKRRGEGITEEMGLDIIGVGKNLKSQRITGLTAPLAGVKSDPR